MKSESSHKDILIIEKTYNFYLALNNTISFIAKKDRFTIGAKCESITLDILEKLYEANSKFGRSRLDILKAIDIKLKIIQTLIKALFDLKSISNQQFSHFSEQLMEIGRMLGGWIKSTND